MGAGGCDPRARTRITPAHARSSRARHPPACAKPGNRFVELPHVRERASAGIKSLDQLASVHASRERSDMRREDAFDRGLGRH